MLFRQISSKTEPDNSVDLPRTSHEAAWESSERAIDLHI